MVNQAASRTMVNQASRSIRDLRHAGEHWGDEAQGRAPELANELREQDNRTLGAVSQKVEHNPLTGLSAAFAIGFAVADQALSPRASRRACGAAVDCAAARGYS